MKIKSTLMILGLTTVISLQASPLRTQAHRCSDIRYPPPSIRAPPSGGYKGHNFGAWVPPPAEHLYGTYHISHSSYDQHVSSFVNLRIERYPVYPNDEDHPAGSQVEIDSWSTCADAEAAGCKDTDATSTLFGYHTPMGVQGPTDKKYAAAWSYDASGRLEGKVNELSATLGWGVDHDGFDYFMQYETGPIPTLNNTSIQESGVVIASRNEKGIDQATYICLTSSLKQLTEELNDQELSDAVSRIRPLHTDDRRDGEGPVECDGSCVSNTDVEF